MQSKLHWKIRGNLDRSSWKVNSRLHWNLPARFTENFTKCPRRILRRFYETLAIELMETPLKDPKQIKISIKVSWNVSNRFQDFPTRLKGYFTGSFGKIPMKDSGNVKRELIKILSKDSRQISLTVSLQFPWQIKKMSYRKFRENSNKRFMKSYNVTLLKRFKPNFISVLWKFQ